jgi:D-sedoheptulose 7-phosphate isomerase
VQVARAGGAFTIGWSGYQGGKLAKMVDLPIVIPSDSIEQIEDIHLMMAHMVTVSVRQAAQNGFLLNHNQAFSAVMADPVVVAR